MITSNKILINRKPLNNSLIKASFFMLSLSVIFYIYTNISTVFTLINYKKSILSLEKKSEELVFLENSISNLKYALNTKDTESVGLFKINSTKFVVRKDPFSMFSINYEIR